MNAATSAAVTRTWTGFGIRAALGVASRVDSSRRGRGRRLRRLLFAAAAGHDAAESAEAALFLAAPLSSPRAWLPRAWRLTRCRCHPVKPGCPGRDLRDPGLRDRLVGDVLAITIGQRRRRRQLLRGDLLGEAIETLGRFRVRRKQAALLRRALVALLEPRQEPMQPLRRVADLVREQRRPSRRFRSPPRGRSPSRSDRGRCCRPPD